MRSVVSQNVIPHKKYLGGAVPFAFTEIGVAMLSSVLKSKIAIDLNIAIVRAFITVRKVAPDYEEIMDIISGLRLEYDVRFDELYKALDSLISKSQNPVTRVGFLRKGEAD